VPEDKVTEVNIYAYSLDETKRDWLKFEIKPKLQLIEFLKQRGYTVVEKARMTGRSGAQYSVDILASRDDGVINHDVAIGVEVAGEEIGLERMQAFDEKAYDIGIHDKILIVMASLGKEAKKFASQQRINVLEVPGLEAIMLDAPQPGEEVKKEAFRFKSKSQLIQYLRQRGYQVREEADVKGSSGATHNIDILATRDDGIITHNIGIGIEVSEAPIGLDRVFDFDDKAYDTGIHDKALIAVPGLSREGRQFAQRQRIRVFEAEQLEPPS
jgi:general secretion pathway protein E